MIHGLKLTIPAEELREALTARIEQLEEAVGRYRADLEMDPKDQTDEHPWLPENILENMIDERLGRIAGLELIRDHIVSGEIYLLDKSDLQFAELLPPPEPEPPICMARR